MVSFLFRLVGLATANGTALELTVSLIKLRVALIDVAIPILKRMFVC